MHQHFLNVVLFSGCYYQYQYYEEGEQIRTSEPCLNCTCHNQMLMCYLRVCPFIKPVGKNCVVEKREDQCCPTIMCPEGKNITLGLQIGLLYNFGFASKTCYFRYVSYFYSILQNGWSFPDTMYPLFSVKMSNFHWYVTNLHETFCHLWDKEMFQIMKIFLFNSFSNISYFSQFPVGRAKIRPNNFFLS